MKTRTHYLGALGVLHGFILWHLRTLDIMTAWLYTIWSVGLAVVALLPNIIDRWVGPEWTHNGVLLRRYRHPLSHSPWTLGYFIILWGLADVLAIPHFSFLIIGCGLSWGSHLFLDALNPEGIPLGTQPTITTHPVRHYRWTRPAEARKLRMGRVVFNDLKANARISQIGLVSIIANTLVLGMLSLVQVI